MSGPGPRPLLFARFPALAGRLPFSPLCDALPSPVRPLPGLATIFGRIPPPLWLKDDGAIAHPYGGNKPRKLEWVLPDVQRRGKRAIFTIGGIGTHHGLATAIYARRAGLSTVLALADQPQTAHTAAQLERLRATGADLHRTHGPLRTALAVPWLWLRHGAPYFLWVGGSSPLGTVGFVEAALELAAQVERGELPAPATIVCALGSGGTAAGLVLGLRLAGLQGTRVLAVKVADLPLAARTVARLATRTAALLVRAGADLPADARHFTPADFDLDLDHLGAEYGAPLASAEAAIALLRDREGLTLDPVYTGKTMAALIDRVRGGKLDRGPVLYWHTYNALELSP